MSRSTSMGREGDPQRFRVNETVTGVGPTIQDALQNLLDRLERRTAEIREELVREREVRR